jgi:uncharacterized membrane protein (UPF0127 family)
MRLKVNQNIFNIKTLIDEKSKYVGMMGKKFEGFEGMLFFMGEDYHCFYMKNCIIPLDIILINNDFSVQSIFDNCLPCGIDDNCTQYCGEAKYVLEIEGGSCESLGILEGDKCMFTFEF